MVTGSIVMFAGNSAPNGWLICDGSAVSRSSYSKLFGIIGTTYGAGDGSTTFNLPDLKGRLLVGTSPDITLNSAGGEEVHSLSVDEIPAHSHTVASHGHTNGITVTTPRLSHSVTQASFSYNKPTMTALIGTGTGRTYAAFISTVNAERRIDVSVDTHPATDCTVSGSISDCSQFDTESDGEGNAHSNMQPFITMNYIIKTGA